MGKFMFFVVLVYVFSLSASYASDFSEDQQNVYEQRFDSIYDEVVSTYDDPSDITYNDTINIGNAVGNLIRYNSLFIVVGNECSEPYSPLPFSSENDVIRYDIFRRAYLVCIQLYSGLAYNASTDALKEYDAYYDQLLGSLNIKED